MQVTVKEGGAALLPAVEALWLTLFEHHVALLAEREAVAPLRGAPEALERRFERFRRELGEGGATLFLAEDRGEVVGFALVRAREGQPLFETGERTAELETMAVAPGRRGEGIGTLLLGEVRRRLAGEGIRYLSLTVLAGNDGALGFYERAGMKTTHLRLLGPVA